MSEPLLKVTSLTKAFPIRSGLLQRQTGAVHAVNGVDFHIDAGETLGLVGESGCGKSTTGRCVLRLIEPTSGDIIFEGKNVRALDGEALRALRRDLQIIFQDPYASLNPRMTVGAIIGEALVIHKLAKTAREFDDRIANLLETVGLKADHRTRFPHEFSGGQRQRIGIARALAVEPKLIICDDPVSALDVSIRSQILNLLRDLQERLSLAYIFVSHDLAVVKHIAGRVAVMNLGRIVETAATQSLFAAPRHPYTRALLSAIPVPKPAAKRSRILLQGEMPSALHPPSGCSFHPRCAYVVDRCRAEMPTLVADAEAHATACHRTAELPEASGIVPSDGALSPTLEKLVAAFGRTAEGTARTGVGTDDARPASGV
jgi:oligopeptide/dipeptide ABC transporter ATP-binding protein